MTSSTHTPNAARSPLATQGLGVAYATGAIISAQFGAALAARRFVRGPVSSGWRSLSSVSP